MKRNNIIQGIFVALLALLIVSCDAIVDEQFLENSTTVEGVELVATQNSANGNTIELSMNTPGVTGYWDYNLGVALTNKVEIVYPIPGTSTFTFIGTLGAEFFEKTIDVTVDVLDTPLDQDWYDLVSESTSEGKTWVFDGGPTPDGRFWWFMSDPGNPWGVWWNAAGDCCPPADAAGRMSFDLDGAANFTYYSGPDADPATGSFVLDVANQTLTIDGGVNILGSMEGGGNAGVFNIVELTEDKMVLHVPDAAWATGWTWVFVPAE
ncbi:hypothetical protein [Draconibacterium sediminis]|uniref:Uncharacterized protein n=1 Tax=Draconibacterium sediminis TaxID=1544798 RepID=A0A0D8J8J5_9BACT|nr:hypothetical protein [Draconibacterium sediminis]KJF42816.1 hypothetical protein LH29_15420 [Draconibacterium sediminis]